MAQPWTLMCSKRFFTSYHFLQEEIGFASPLQCRPPSQADEAGGDSASIPSAGLPTPLQAPLTHGGRGRFSFDELSRAIVISDKRLTLLSYRKMGLGVAGGGLRVQGS